MPSPDQYARAHALVTEWETGEETIADLVELIAAELAAAKWSPTAVKPAEPADRLAQLIRDGAAATTGDPLGEAAAGLTFRLSDDSRVAGIVSAEDAAAPWVRVWPGPLAPHDHEDIPQVIARAHIVRVQWTSHAHQ